MSENGLSRGGSDRRSDEAPLLFHPSSSGRLELHRRCFSCCNVVLRQEASLANGQRRAVVSAVKNTAVFLVFCHINNGSPKLNLTPRREAFPTYMSGERGRPKSRGKAGLVYVQLSFSHEMWGDRSSSYRAASTLPGPSACTCRLLLGFLFVRHRALLCT